MLEIVKMTAVDREDTELCKDENKTNPNSKSQQESGTLG
jgi:hypothetical protein